MSFMYKDQALSIELSFDAVIVKSQQLFYNLNPEEYDIISGEKPIPSEKTIEENNPIQKVD